MASIGLRGFGSCPLGPSNALELTWDQLESGSLLRYHLTSRSVFTWAYAACGLQTQVHDSTYLVWSVSRWHALSFTVLHFICSFLFVSVLYNFLYYVIFLSFLCSASLFFSNFWLSFFIYLFMSVFLSFFLVFFLSHFKKLFFLSFFCSTFLFSFNNLSIYYLSVFVSASEMRKENSN